MRKPRLRLSHLEDRHSAEARASLAADILNREVSRWRGRKRWRLSDVVRPSDEKVESAYLLEPSGVCRTMR